ncbi:MAG: N-6 DNA methylase [Pseudoxanthomonas sp.]
MQRIEQLQQQWTQHKPREARKKAGQFFTPRWIAHSMARWVLDAKPARILDPAFGFGILLDECFRQGFEGTASAYEADAELVRAWRDGMQNSVELRGEDFLSAQISEVEAAIVNPPYNRFQNRDLPARTQMELRQTLGEFASGYTNQYALFLYRIISRLGNEGRAAFIVPSEFLATGYGLQTKRFLIQNQRLKHLILFDTHERIFDDAATTACILLFDKGRQAQLHVWHLSGEADAGRLHAICSGTARDTVARLDYAQLNPAANWQNLGHAEELLPGMTPLLTFGRAKRGIATGANEFFVLDRPQARHLGLRDRDWRPCIASADSAPGKLFDDDDWQALAQGGSAALLFDGSSSSKAALRYVARGESCGFHQRYLTRTRSPWYRLEQREPAPLLLAVFGRGGFRAVLNRSAALNLTAFHGFHPHPGCARTTELLWLYLQTLLARQAFSRQQRSYGDGLKKLEPGDWNKLLVPDFRQWEKTMLRHAQTLVRRAITCLKKNDTTGWQAAVQAFSDLTAGQCDRLFGPAKGEQLRLA